MIEDWPSERLGEELRQRDRVLVLFYGSWCPFSRIFMRAFEATEPDASVPFARTDLRASGDALWDRYNIPATPTLIYFEHGEEMERADGIKGRGLSVRDLEEMVELAASYEEEPTLPKRMHGPRRR